MHSAAAAACHFVQRPHCQELGREIVAFLCYCCGIVVVRGQVHARCPIMRNPRLVVGQGLRVLLSGRCARVKAAGAAWHWVSPPCTIVRPLSLVRCFSCQCNRSHAVAADVCRCLQGPHLGHQKPITVP